MNQQMWSIHMLDYDSDVDRNQLLTCATTCLSLKSIMLSDRSYTESLKKKSSAYKYYTSDDWNIFLVIRRYFYKHRGLLLLHYPHASLPGAMGCFPVAASGSAPLCHLTMLGELALQEVGISAEGIPESEQLAMTNLDKDVPENHSFICPSKPK